MCIGIPMRVVTLEADGWALCQPRSGEAERIDMRLVESVPEGGWVLTFMGAARDIMSDDDARMVSDALEALVIVQNGGSVDHLFADLVGREPQLPEHLRKQ